MFILPIDEKSCIIEPYFDGGDTYVGHEKYSVVDKYKTWPKKTMHQEWDSVRIEVAPKGKTVIERSDLSTDISDYERFRIFGMTPECVTVRLYCNDELVIDKKFGGKIEMLDGDVRTTQSVINTLRFEFENSDENPVTVILHYLGMIKDKPQNKVPYNNDWEGFFAENPTMDIFDETMISERELEKIRERVKTEPLSDVYSVIRKRAFEQMEKEPEKQIKRTVADFFREPNNISGNIGLAIVGQIEKNYEMLKRACRGVLSLACCEYWSGDPMETAPTITWHHRSFAEAGIAREISVVISLAGNLLSWHGRNFLYNMIIMKALPRMEADFMTMEYIYHMNQGLAFMSGYIPALVTLVKQYPRYEGRIKEAEELLGEMMSNAFSEDGSTDEGAGYWNYTILSYLYSAYFLSRYKKQSLKEYIGDRLDKTSEFALSLLDEGGNLITFNDCSPGSKYSTEVTAFMYAVTGDERWAKVNSLNYKIESGLALLFYSFDIPETDVSLVNEFYYSPGVGYTQVCRDGIRFLACSGPSNNTHCHGDKGSFVIYKNGNVIVPDPSGAYNKSTTVLYFKTACHSLAVPVIDDIEIEQLRGKEYASYIAKTSYEKGVFEWQCDNSKIWDSKEVKKSIRSIYSDKANEFIITDEFEFTKPTQLLFRINVLNEKDIEVQPIDWNPVKEKIIRLCSYEDTEVYQICKLSEKRKNIKIKTKIIVK